VNITTCDILEIFKYVKNILLFMSYTTGNQTGDERRAFTNTDFDRYQAILQPYLDRMSRPGEILTPKDTRYLAGLEAELLRDYTPQSIADSGISGVFGRITGRDELRKDVIWRRQLVAEERALTLEIGASSPERRAEIYQRLHEIRSDLEPEHCL